LPRMTQQFKMRLLRAADALDIEASRMRHLAKEFREWVRTGREPDGVQSGDAAASDRLVLVTGPKSKGKKDVFDPTVLTLPFEGEAFKTAWLAWCKGRREQRKPLTPTGAVKQLGMLGGLDLNHAIATLEQSTMNQWQGLLPNKVEGFGKGRAKSFQTQKEDTLVERMTEAQARAQK
jgi:hypothetical protein